MVGKDIAVFDIAKGLVHIPAAMLLNIPRYVSPFIGSQSPIQAFLNCLNYIRARKTSASTSDACKFLSPQEVLPLFSLKFIFES